MLVWATEFPARRGAVVEDLRTIAKDWLVGSPHGSWQEADFADEPLNEITEYEVGAHKALVARAAVDGQEWYGMRHSWTENEQRTWVTEIVGHQGADRMLVSIRVDCNLLAPGLDLPTAKKPYIVRLAVERLGGALDGGLAVSDKPVELEEVDVEVASKIILGELDNTLPVVYVSTRRHQGPYVDAGELAKWLSGMAHVVVEPSRMFSFQVARTAQGANAYGGAVGIYWPRGIARQIRFLPRQYSSRYAMQQDIAAKVRGALTQIQPTSTSTWAHVREIVSRLRLESLKDSGSASVDDWVEAFSAESAAKDERIHDLQSELNRLRGDLWRLQRASYSEGEGLLRRGEEDEYYAGEIRDTILSALERARNSVRTDGRRQHLVDDLLQANDRSGFEDEFEEELKGALSTMTTFGGEQRATLEKLGFSVEEGGKHVKAVFRGDSRYTFTISKTSSDHRAGKNLVGQIRQTLFS